MSMVKSLQQVHIAVLKGVSFFHIVMVQHTVVLERELPQVAVICAQALQLLAAAAATLAPHASAHCLKRGEDGETHAHKSYAPRPRQLPCAQAVLERLLQQLVATRAEALAANGGVGQPFLLRQHLLPPPPAKVSALSAMADMVE